MAHVPGSLPKPSQPKRGKPDPAAAPEPAGETVRINKFLASAGYGSRRQVEELIQQGRVDIDGQTVTSLATTVMPETQTVRVDSDVLRPQRKVYYAVNKPTGIVSTARDPAGRPRVIDLVPPTQRVFSVGRLDLSSEGLILLTNDGDLAQKLAHPKFGVMKVYRVVVAGSVTPETLRKMEKGLYIAEGVVRVDGARILKARPKATEMEIRLREGKNREIRRILAKFGHKVQTLRRIAIGPLRLGDVPPGAYRVLTRQEIKKLQETAGQPTAGEKTPSKRSAKPGSAKPGTPKPGAKRPGGAAGRNVAAKRSGKPAGPAIRKASRKASAGLRPPKSTGGRIIGGD